MRAARNTRHVTNAAKDAVLSRFRGGLIVSVQAEAGSPLDTPEAIVLLARVAVRNGAVGLRIEGAANIAAVKAALDVPVVGIVKRAHAGFDPYITSTVAEIGEASRAGADVVAFDATDRPHAAGAAISRLVDAAHAHGSVAMADCADVADAGLAAAAGADILASTLAGYTAATRGRALPALDLITAAAAVHPFVVCEGGIARPEDARAAFAAGAAAIVVGTAITNVDVLVRRFAATAPREGTRPRT